MQKVEHIGIAVKSLSETIPVFEKLLNTACYKREVVESEQVETAFFMQGDTKIELLQSTADNSVIAKFINKRGSGLHHIAFEVENIEEEIQRLQHAGFTVLNSTPKRGADNKLVCFVHPANTFGVLIELCQSVS